MENKIKEILHRALDLIDKCENLDSLERINQIRVQFLGKNGELTSVLRGMKDIAPELKPVVGKFVNAARDEITSRIEGRIAELTALSIAQKLNSESVDITLSSKRNKKGGLHPCTLVINEILGIFTSMGFQVKQGPEVETDFFNFQTLNIPKDHPAREMQDTFYISDDLLLRTHTSPMQARTMISQQPPIRIVNPGKVYRPDDDATHSPMFQQIEGLVVDKGITMCDLKGILDTFAKALFNENTKTRLRPSFFPFTEPSVEVDVTCAMCGGKGCRICKGTGWIEILGAGIVNPKVLENCGIDSNVYSGFAFGCGIERIAMIKYGIPDMRILFDNDIRFLKQFN
ncbi:MAG: phenylalanine--tRNA ligase subunit alpha [Clostridia bacterium]|nr:phenylalanine--tRNA ligase subunit alpha [Clostridia bacterium]